MVHGGSRPFCCDGKNFLLSQFTGPCSQPVTEAFLMLPSYATNPHIGQVLAISATAAQRILLSSLLKHSISLSFDYCNPFFFFTAYPTFLAPVQVFSEFCWDYPLICYRVFFWHSYYSLIFFFNLHVTFSHTRGFPLKLYNKCLNAALTSGIPRTAETHCGMNPWGRYSVGCHTYKTGRTDWECEGLL